MTHGNIIADIASIKEIIRQAPSVTLDSNSVVLSYLPLAHVFERVACNTFIGEQKFR